MEVRMGSWEYKAKGSPNPTVWLQTALHLPYLIPLRFMLFARCNILKWGCVLLVMVLYNHCLAWYERDGYSWR